MVISVMLRYNNNVRILSNSWGSGSTLTYDSFCSQTDKFVWDYKDMVILYSAGNSGDEGYDCIFCIIVDLRRLTLLDYRKT